MALKFENVDILDALESIMKIHTQNYQEDFDLDRSLIQSLSKAENKESRRLLWMSRPHGTYCLSERNVHLQDSHANKVWMYYMEQTSDPILAYALHLKGQQDGKILGDIVQLDYRTHAQRVKQLTCPIAQAVLSFADGTVACVPYKGYRKQIQELSPIHGTIQAVGFAPESERELDAILRRERSKREHHATPGDMQKHIAGLKKQSVKKQLKTASAPVTSVKDGEGARTMKEDNMEKTYGVWAVRSAQSIFGHKEAWCKDDGKPLEFPSYEAAAAYAAELNRKTTVNVHYYPKERQSVKEHLKEERPKPNHNKNTHPLKNTER